MKITHKRAIYDYDILETYEVGIKLTGAEVKSVKGGRMSLEGSFVRIIGHEAYLLNAQIFPYLYAQPEGYDPKRTRKLLLHKKQIMSLKGKISSSGLTLVALECYNTHGLVKLKIALAKGKKQYQKKEKIKRRDIDREVEREIKRR